MDKMLERMLSLIPRKPDGKYVHGAKKAFCESIGAPSNIVSEWEAGKTKSYRSYLYNVSAVYNVSVEWLRGETDDPEIKKDPSLSTEALDPAVIQLMEEVKTLPPELLDLVANYVRDAKKIYRGTK